jgi:hypothetical protein
MLDHFSIIISSDNNNVTPNVVVDYEPTQRLGADTINEIKSDERFSDVDLISFMIVLGGSIVFHTVIKIIQRSELTLFGMFSIFLRTVSNRMDRG